MLHIISAKRVFVKERPRNFTRVLHSLHSWRKSGKEEPHKTCEGGRGLCGEERRQKRAERGHGKEQDALPPAHVAAAKAADQMGGEQGDERGQHRLAEAVRGPRGQGGGR